MTLPLQFLFDFGSPNAYLVHRVLPEFAAQTGLIIETVPVLLGGIFKATHNQSPYQAYAQIPAKLQYELLEMRRFIERHGLHEFQMNPHFPLNTLQLMRGAVAARMLGVAEAYDGVMFRAAWEQGRLLTDAAVWAQTITEAGLDAQALMQASQSDEVKQQLITNTEWAVSKGVFGVPSFLLGDELWFGKERLRDIAERITPSS